MQAVEVIRGWDVCRHCPQFEGLDDTTFILFFKPFFFSLYISSSDFFWPSSLFLTRVHHKYVLRSTYYLRYYNKDCAVVQSAGRPPLVLQGPGSPCDSALSGCHTHTQPKTRLCHEPFPPNLACEHSLPYLQPGMLSTNRRWQQPIQSCP